MKQKVQQAAMMQEHSWTPLGTQMPASAALPPSSAKPLTARSAMPASTVKRMRYPLACIDEEDAAAPRRLSYSSECIWLCLHSLVKVTCSNQLD